MTKKRFFNENELVFKEIPSNVKSIEGMCFDELIVLGFAEIKNRESHWFCKCGCGNVVKVLRRSLVSHNTRSCGCLQKKIVSINSLKHGQAGKDKKRSKLYSVWSAMIQRCTNSNNKHYKNYGGRGISVCESWLNFENFLIDMGEAPLGLSIERNDVNGNYEPSNCRWATRKEQANNQRNNHLIEFNNEIKTMAQWSEDVGILAKTLYSRLVVYGWSVERALTTPVI